MSLAHAPTLTSQKTAVRLARHSRIHSLRLVRFSGALIENRERADCMVGDSHGQFSIEGVESSCTGVEAGATSALSCDCAECAEPDVGARYLVAGAVQSGPVGSGIFECHSEDCEFSAGCVFEKHHERDAGIDAAWLPSAEVRGDHGGIEIIFAGFAEFAHAVMLAAQRGLRDDRGTGGGGKRA